MNTKNIGIMFKTFAFQPEVPSSKCFKIQGGSPEPEGQRRWTQDKGQSCFLYQISKLYIY